MGGEIKCEVTMKWKTRNGKKKREKRRNIKILKKVRKKKWKKKMRAKKRWFTIDLL
jgi:hypothetical protein